MHWNRSTVFCGQQQIHIAPTSGCNRVSVIISVFYFTQADGTFKNRNRREISLFTDYVTSPVFWTKDSHLTDYVTSPVFYTKDLLLTNYVTNPVFSTKDSLLTDYVTSPSFGQKTRVLQIML
jgi:hypothetical protein